MGSRFLPVLSFVGAIALSVASGSAQDIDDAQVFGSFVHFESLPNVLFLVGEIKNGDFFELRKAMREHDPKLIVVSSPGGSVYEALQLATVIHDNGLATYVPSGGDCASACAFVFFGGADRLIAGQLGVHQFYSATGSTRDQLDGTAGLKAAQYTTAEIIGFLNEFQTPPFVYERMFSTEDMHYFSGEDVAQLSLGTDDPELPSLRTLAQDLFTNVKDQISTALTPAVSPYPDASTPAPPDPVPLTFDIHSNTDLFGGDLVQSGIRNISLAYCEQLCRANDACQAYTFVLAKNWRWPKGSVGTLTYKSGAVSGIKRIATPSGAFTAQARALIAGINRIWSLPNGSSLSQLPDFYTDPVQFYGEWLTRDQVMAEKLKFAQRWPVRRYLVVPDSVQINCVDEGCSVQSIISWAAEAPERGARSSGRSTWNLVLISDGQKLRIGGEAGEVISRD